jgi:hypothetical protein
MKKYRPNPSLTSDLRQAISRWHRFSGHDGKVVARLNAATTRGVLTPKSKSVLIVVGSLDFVGYTTKRDGKVESYQHRFAKHARPLLAVSHDGHNLYILGGEYRFTARGIVDSRK